MTQDEIIEMARQARMMDTWDGWVSRDVYKASGVQTDNLEAFAKLVAAKEREACEKRFMQLFLDHENQPTQFGTATQEYRELEIKIERELCVKAVADALYGQDGCYKAMRAIRARGEA